MSDPDKTYAKNAISKASKDYKIAIEFLPTFIFNIYSFMCVIFIALAN